MRRSTSSSSLLEREGQARDLAQQRRGAHRLRQRIDAERPAGHASRYPSRRFRVEERVDGEQVDLAGLRAGQASPCGGSRWATRSGPGRRSGTRAGPRPTPDPAPGRSSTTATGTAPRRRSSRLTTAAPRTAGCRSSAALMSSGRTLNPPRMIAWSARPRMKRKPSSSSRARSVVRTQASLPNCLALTSRRPSTSGATGAPDSASTTRSSQPSWARPTLPRLAAQNFL